MGTQNGTNGNTQEIPLGNTWERKTEHKEIALGNTKRKTERMGTHKRSPRECIGAQNGTYGNTQEITPGNAWEHKTERMGTQKRSP